MLVWFYINGWLNKIMIEFNKHFIHSLLMLDSVFILKKLISNFEKL